MIFVELVGATVNAESIDLIAPIRINFDEYDLESGFSFQVTLRNGKEIIIADKYRDHLEITRNRLIQTLTHRRIESF